MPLNAAAKSRVLDDAVIVMDAAGPYGWLDFAHPAPVTFEGRAYPTAYHALVAWQVNHEGLRERLGGLKPKLPKKKHKQPDGPGKSREVLLAELDEVVAMREYRDFRTAGRKSETLALMRKRLTREKFLQNADLLAQLLETGGAMLVDAQDAVFKDAKMLMALRDEFANR